MYSQIPRVVLYWKNERFIIPILLCVIVLFTGCRNNRDMSKDIAADETTDSFSDASAVDAVIDLIVSAQIPDYPSTVNSYSAEFFQPEEEIAIRTLMTHEPDQRQEWALGPQYRYKNVESLQFCNEVVCGGLQYVKYAADSNTNIQAELKNLKTGITPQEYPSNNAGKEPEGLLHFSQEKELESLTRKDLMDALDQLWIDLKFPSLEMRACYARDKDTLNRNLEQYNNQLRDSNPDEIYEYSFTDEDEDYFVLYRQLVDGIPIISQSWYGEAESSPTNTVFEVVYSPLYGLTSLQVSNLFEVGEMVSAIEIVEPGEAVDTYMKEYEKSLHFGTTEIIDIELNYIVLHDGNVLLLRPSWILTAKTVSQDEVASYEITAIDAESLEIIRSGSIGK